MTAHKSGPTGMPATKSPYGDKGQLPFEGGGSGRGTQHGGQGGLGHGGKKGGGAKKGGMAHNTPAYPKNQNY